MVKLYDGGVYLINGTQIVPENEQAEIVNSRKISKEEAKKGTIAYSIMEAHNTSGDMDHLNPKIRIIVTQINS